MGNKKACKLCKRIYEEGNCPSCGSNEYVKDYKGILVVFDPVNSDIAKSMKINNAGEYAVKVK
ncbi:MAG: transcription elongation factor subunit Spt4 [Nanoarchaeota archaeon]